MNPVNISIEFKNLPDNHGWSCWVILQVQYENTLYTYEIAFETYEDFRPHDPIILPSLPPPLASQATYRAFALEWFQFQLDIAHGLDAEVPQLSSVFPPTPYNSIFHSDVDITNPSTNQPYTVAQRPIINLTPTFSIIAIIFFYYHLFYVIEI